MTEDVFEDSASTAKQGQSATSADSVRVGFWSHIIFVNAKTVVSKFMCAQSITTS